MTLKQLERFVRVRNNARFHTNLQFDIDANTCGFKTDALGDAKKQDDGSYVWTTPHGRLIESNGTLALADAREQA